MRCRACDKVMAPTEIIWREDLQDHEDFCLSCRQKHLLDEYDIDVGGDTTDNLNEQTGVGVRVDCYSGAFLE